MCDAIHYRAYEHMHRAFFWATVLWNLCQTSMQPDSKQRKRYLRPGTFNSRGFSSETGRGSVACVKSQGLVGQPRAALCLWATSMGSEVTGSFATNFKRGRTAPSVLTVVSFHWYRLIYFRFGQGCPRWISCAVKEGCEILYVLLNSKNIFFWLSNT